jgi:hypothetical protein
MARSNCFIWAVCLWIRRLRKGDDGYVAFRKSKYGPFFHALYVHRKRRWISYVPVNPRKRLLPPPLFEGRVKWGD